MRGTIIRGNNTVLIIPNRKDIQIENEKNGYMRIEASFAFLLW